MGDLAVTVFDVEKPSIARSSASDGRPEAAGTVVLDRSIPLLQNPERLDPLIAEPARGSAGRSGRRLQYEKHINTDVRKSTRNILELARICAGRRG